jgi:glycosyltransferase involved in cell wall biosynthesis
MGNIDHKNHVRLIGHIPINNVPQNMINIIYTMMETKKFNKDFINTCKKNYHICFTPTESNKETFIESGFNKPIYVLPIGIDDVYINQKKLNKFIPIYKKFHNKITNQSQPEGFKFLSIFRWNFRKSPEVLIRAYLEEFTIEDNVSLVLFSKNMLHRLGPQFENYISSKINKLLIKYGKPNSAPIFLSEQTIDSEDMPDVYAIGDVFVLPSRGEGFCLPALEASAMGLPIIVTDITGFKDYCDDDNSYLLQVDKYETYEKMTDWYKDDAFIGVYANEEFPVLGDDFVAQLKYKMREVKNKYDEAKIKNSKMIDLIKTRYTWDKCVDNMENILINI